MVRIAAAALAAILAMPILASLPAQAQVTYAPEAFPLAGASGVAVRQNLYPVVGDAVLVPRTRYVRRTILVPRTRYVRRRVVVPVTVYRPEIAVPAYRVGPYAPAPGYALPYAGTGWTGPTWVPPGTRYACQLGTIGCDSSVVGAVGF